MQDVLVAYKMLPSNRQLGKTIWERQMCQRNTADTMWWSPISSIHLLDQLLSVKNGQKWSKYDGAVGQTSWSWWFEAVGVFHLVIAPCVHVVRETPPVSIPVMLNTALAALALVNLA